MDLAQIDSTRKTIGELIKTFQFAIIDMTAYLHENQTTISEEDKEDLLYAIGMAQVASSNIDNMLDEPDGFFVSDADEVAEFVSKNSSFAAALKKGGFGFPPKDSD